MSSNRYHEGAHKYYKSNTGWGKNKKIVYRCALPTCPHYVIPEAVLNKLCKCWRCGQDFVLPKALSLLASKPWCADCSERRKKKKITFANKSTIEFSGEVEEPYKSGNNLDDFIKDLMEGKK